MSNQESAGKTIAVAGVVCLVCSIFVSSAAVSLKPQQLQNKLLDKKLNILSAAGVPDSETDSAERIESLFENIEIRQVNFATGEYVDYDPSDLYDQRKAAKDPSLGRVLDGKIDIAGIKRQALKGLVYLAKGASGEVETIILPVHGYGLWSTLYGFLALEPDANTIKGLGFYEHAETPGLGGEVNNPNWKAQWTGKQLFDTAGLVGMRMYKGTVDSNTIQGEMKFDAIAGATITSRGVEQLIQFWAGEQGFGPYLKKIQKEGV